MKFSEVENTVRNLIRSHSRVSDAVYVLLDTFKADSTTQVYGTLKSFDYEVDSVRINRAIERTLAMSPPPPSINAFWFGIWETQASYEAYISGADNIDPDDDECEWASAPSYSPDDNNLDSVILREVHSLSYEVDSDILLNLFAAWYLALAIGIYAKQKSSAFTRLPSSYLLAIGFDSGDPIVIGEVSPTGLELRPKRAVLPAVLKSTKTKHEYYAIEEEMKWAWSLDTLRGKDGSEYVSGFGNLSKFLSADYGLITSFNDSTDGVPVDFANVVLCGPVVSERFRQIIVDYASEKDVQFVPVSIRNYEASSFYLMNVLALIDCFNREASTFAIGNYAHEIVLSRDKASGAQIFRLKTRPVQNFVYINSQIKEALEKIGATGLKLTGIRVI